MGNKVEFFKALETKMWDAAINKDSEEFMKLVSKDAVMVCGGYRCSGIQYAEFIKEGIASSYEFLEFEVICSTEEIAEVHYVINVECNDDKNSECSGKFHVTSTWMKTNDSYKLIFNMDSRIFE